MRDPEGFYSCDYCKMKMGTAPKMVVGSSHYCSMDCTHELEKTSVARNKDKPKKRGRPKQYVEYD